MGRRGRRRARERQPSGLPSNFKRSWETGARLLEQHHSGVSLEEMIAERRGRLRDLMSGADAVHAAGHVIMSETFTDPNTYSESEHPGLAYVIELVAAELLCRPGRAGSTDTTPALDKRFTEEVRRFAQEATHLEAFRRYRNAGGLESPESAARGRAAGHHLMMRAPGWPWQEHAVLRGLFGPEHIARRLQSVLGFDAEDAIRCSEAVADDVPDRLSQHMGDALDRAADFGPGNEAYEWASATLNGWQDAPATESFRAHAMSMLWALNRIGEALVVDAGSVSKTADVTASAASAYLKAFSLGFGQPEEDWFTLAEQVRYRPFIDLGDGSFMPTVPGGDLWAMRLVFEAALKDFKPYATHRGRWLETAAVRMLADALSPDEVHESLHFSYSDQDGRVVTGEIDGLIRLGDTALLVEAKGATLRPGARRGGEALITHLRENVTKAATQGEKARGALRIGDCFTKGGAAVELGRPIREAHPIVVTLDDLSSSAPVIWEFAGTRVMPEGVTIPWVVTLHELEHVCATVEWSAQFVHFLRRRSRLNARGGISATDELDWWMHYLTRGLYFEDEDAAGTRLASHTDPLDAWVLYDKGLREEPAAKPGVKLDKTTRSALDLLHAERPDGWVAVACTLLDPASEARHDLWKHVQKMRRRARERQKVQRLTLGFEDAPDPILICSIVVPDTNRQFLAEHLEQCVAERVEQYGLQRTLGLGHVVSSRRPYDALVVFEKAWWEEEK